MSITVLTFLVFWSIALCSRPGAVPYKKRALYQAKLKDIKILKSLYIFDLDKIKLFS